MKQKLLRRIILLSVLLNLSFFFADAQNTKITLDKKETSLSSVLEAIEKQTNLKFFFLPSLTDSIKVSVQLEKESLNNSLTKILTPLNLYYAIDAENRVFITDNSPIITSFSQTPTSLTLPAASDGSVISNDFSPENRLFEIGNKETAVASEKILSGYIKGESTGKPIHLAIVSVSGFPKYVLTDEKGYYSLPVPESRITVLYQSPGKQATSRQIIMHSSGSIDIELAEQAHSLKEVVVSADRTNNLSRTIMGLEKISVKTIKQTPTILGEADIISVILALPGVQTVGEAASGFNVRGGATDQNLVLFGDATVYNPSHFFGLFSAFNADAINEVELYKSSIPARYGGRLASVLDVAPKMGNKDKLSGAGGIGLLTSRLSLEGPISKKTSFLASGRSTYSDWLLRFIPDESYKNSGATFYDASLQIDHQFNEQNALILSGYTSKDKFSFHEGPQYGYNNNNLNLKWKNQKSKNAHFSFTAGLDQFGFSVNESKTPAEAYSMQYSISQYFLRGEVGKTVGSHQITAGFQSLLYDISPGSMNAHGVESIVKDRKIDRENALENALFLNDIFTINENLTLDAGLRYVFYSFLGPGTVNNYTEGLPKSINTIVGTSNYEKGEFIKSYNAPEIRLGVRYSFSNKSSVKAGYNSLRQYIHMLSNTTAITPTDSWKLSDTHIRPQFGDQISVGYYQNLNQNKIETSVELYYKRIHNYLDYKSGAQLLMNDHIETDVINTEARAYGLEVLLKKPGGKLNGWFSYAYARILQRTVDVAEGDHINEGRFYPGNFDKPHSANLVGNYRFSHRFSMSLNGTYSTGRPVTLPIGKYYYAGSERVHYSERNKYRIPDFFRLDASINIEGNHKIKKLAHSSWSVGVYNATGRRNPFSVFFVSENGNIKGYKLSVFGSPIPFVTYNFRF